MNLTKCFLIFTGDRAAYNANSELNVHNNARFTAFIERVIACDAKTKHHIHYVGGSWTRRQPENGLVQDMSLCKDNGGDNKYEQAKTSAQQNAHSLATLHSVSIVFYDWISIAPNFNPNCAIGQMVTSAGKCQFIL